MVSYWKEKRSLYDFENNEPPFGEVEETEKMNFLIYRIQVLGEFFTELKAKCCCNFSSVLLFVFYVCETRKIFPLLSDR